MDPFTALGVAAAALQFFDFSRTLLKEYKNQRGDIEALTQHSFQKATEDLLACIERLQKAAPSPKRLGLEAWEEHEKVKLSSFHHLTSRDKGSSVFGFGTIGWC